MSARQRLIRALVRIYPRTWRNEYGPEFEDLLTARPLGVRPVVNVLWHGSAARLGAIDPSTLFGLGAMLTISASLAFPFRSFPGPLLRESLMTFPPVVVTPFKSDFFALYLVGCGFWMHLRRSTTPSQSGRAAVWATFVAGLPVLLVGVLLMASTLDVSTVRHIAAQPYSLIPWKVVAAPLSSLPQAWIWGWAGGRIGTFTRARRSTRTA